MTETASAQAEHPVAGSAGAEPPRPLALSPSRAADFKQCPLLYRFRAIDRLPEARSAAQVRGTLVHAVLDRLYALPAAQRVPAAAHALVAPTWAQLCDADPTLAAPATADPATASPAPASPTPDGAAPDDAVPDDPVPDGPTPDGADPRSAAASAAPAAPAAPSPTDPDPVADPDGADGATGRGWPAGVDTLLDSYFALEDPRSLEPESRELLVEVDLESGLHLRGYVDRIDRIDPGGTPPGAGPSGAYRVVDYKSGTAPGPATEARALFQLKFYALILLLLRGRAPSELRLMYLTGPETLHYVPDEAQLLRFARMLDAMWVAIRAAGAAGDFRPNRGPACAWCSHRPLCPAWDGVPPPYPGWPRESAEAAEPAEPVEPAAAAAGEPAVRSGAG